MASRGGRAKKKRSFLTKAKKYARSGCYGRGQQIDEDTYNYFVRIYERLREEFEDEEEKEIFINNVFTQTRDKEKDLLCNQFISKVMEKLIPMANSEMFEHFANIMLKEMRIICTDPYASHVLEKAMVFSLEKLAKADKDDGSEHVTFCKKWLCSVTQFAFNNFEEFITNIYASHILRTSLRCLSGAEVDFSLIKSARSRNHLDKTSDTALPKYESKEFDSILCDFCERLAAWPQLPDMIFSEDSSAVIQTALACSKKAAPDLCQKLLHVIVNDIFGNLQTDDIFSASAPFHVLEICISVSDEDTFQQLYEKYFKGKLKEIVVQNDLKFAVMKLLDAVKDKEVFAEIFEELAPIIEDIFAAGSGKVVLCLANACHRLSTLQGRYLQHLMEAFHCYTPDSRQLKIVPLVARLVTYDVAEAPGDDKPNFRVEMIGSQIIQTLLQFTKTKKINDSLLAMDNTQLVDLLNSSCGSHIMDAFVSAPFVGEKGRDKMMQKLQGSYFALATNKYGSRALDAIWEASTVKTRISIGEELLEKELALKSNKFGVCLYQSYALELLKRQKMDWKSVQDKNNKKRNLFAGIVEPLGASGGASSSNQNKKRKKT